MKRTDSWPDTKSDAKDQEKSNMILESPKKQESSSKFYSRISTYLQEYCNSSSIHGIRYMGEENRTTTERVWWIIIFIASILMCGHLIMKTWTKWDTSPVIVSFAQSPTPVWQVPFPAVTICSETKARQTVYNFTEAFHKNAANRSQFTEEELKQFEDISLICDNHLYNQGNKTTDKSMVDFLQSVAPQFDEMLWTCKWTNKFNTSCNELFKPMLTEEGLCYTFNMLDSMEMFTEEAQRSYQLKHGVTGQWSLDGGYPKGADMDVYPRRALGAGIKAGLTVLMRAYEYDLDYICRGPVQGFKILLHNPAETPRVSQQYFRAPLNQEVVVAVKPDMMTTSDGLKEYLPSRRQCYFPYERQLHFYKVYTQQNCEVECLTNYTYKRCECVSYHMPHDDTMALCGSGSTVCAAHAQRELLLNEVRREIEEGEDADNDDKISAPQCNCLPACTSLTYNAETSQADFNWQKLFHAYKANFSEFPGIQMTRVNIFFKDNQFITSRRSELYGQTDFLANCGGLLGLFMGFSILSIVEIIYFLTLRMWCNIQMHGRKMWANSNVEKA